jgi:hypothetical protein
MLDGPEVDDWLDRYERAWRSPGTDQLRQLFAETVTYSMSPWAEPIDGLDALGRFWDSSRTTDEAFDMRREIVAIDGRLAVVRVAVEYADGQRWRDLWLIAIDADGRCERFEEWPFAPDQRDGHEDDR